MESIFTKLCYHKESSFGVSPSSDYQALRFTGESFARKLKKEISNEIRSDRQIADFITLDSDIDGGFNFELTYESFTELLEGALWDEWSDEISISAKGISINVDGTLTAGTGATNGSANFYLIEEGHWIKLDGSSDSDNNDYYQVTNKNSNTEITVSPTPNSTLASGSDTITINATHLRNGVEPYSYTFIRAHEKAGISNQYFNFNGCMCTSFSLSLSAGSILTGAFGFLGKTGTLAQTSTESSTATVVTSTKIVNTANNIAELQENGVVQLGCIINSIDINLNNNLRVKKALASGVGCAIGVGRCLVTGSISAYFIDNSLYDKYISGAETSLSFRVADADNNVYILDIPRLKFNDNKINIGGQDQSVMQNIEFTALVDNTYGYTIQLSKFNGSGPGPVSSVKITTEDGDYLITESGDHLII